MWKYGFFTFPNNSNANTFPYNIFQSKPSPKINKEWEAKIQDAQEADDGTVVLNFENLISWSGILMQVNIVSNSNLLSLMS